MIHGYAGRCHDQIAGQEIGFVVASQGPAEIERAEFVHDARQGRFIALVGHGHQGTPRGQKTCHCHTGAGQADDEYEFVVQVHKILTPGI